MKYTTPELDFLPLEAQEVIAASADGASADISSGWTDEEEW